MVVSGRVGGVGVYGEFSYGKRVEVWVDGVVVKGYERGRPCGGSKCKEDGEKDWDETQGTEGCGAGGGRADGVVELEARSPLDVVKRDGVVYLSSFALVARLCIRS
jgi:hypothetical protein